MESKNRDKYRLIKDSALVILVFICGGLILGGNRMSGSFKLEEKKYRERISELLKRNAEQEAVHYKEARIRENNLIVERMINKELKEAKRQDSLRSIRTISSLMSSYKKYNHAQLDSILISEYEKAINSNP